MSFVVSLLVVQVDSSSCFLKIFMVLLMSLFCGAVMSLFFDVVSLFSFL